MVEIVVVINRARNEALERMCDDLAPAVRRLRTPIPGKRNAVKVGTEVSTGEITVLTDSDTISTDGTLAEPLRPFVDETVGGVTTPHVTSTPRVVDGRGRLDLERWRTAGWEASGLGRSAA